MKRILFVDDEPRLLHGLQNAMWKQRKHWEMRFASSGDDALSELAQGHFDVVVCDMRMPGMDGPALLASVKERYPSTARLVLSGQADRQAILRAIPVAQQFLSKPCDPETLRREIERVCTLQACVQDEAVRAIVGGVDSLPPSPSIYLELTAASERPESGLSELATIVERDPALCAKILQLANSAFFGAGQKTPSVRSALRYLGVELLKVLVLAASVFMRADGTTRAPSALLEELQRHSSLLAALMPKFVADRKRAEQAVASALLHDIGLLVFAANARDHLDQIDRQVSSSGLSLSAVERELGRPSHGVAGALLLGTWGLPFDLVEVAAYHHVPSEASEHAPVDILMAVHAAEALVDAIERGESDPRFGIDLAFAERVGLLPKLEAWRAIAGDAMGAARRESR